uniref:Uncharacterized protein n=1 Tax=Arundo donax TaxID=35708 RepID=A0A0A9BSI4_ARUDO
MASSPHTPLGPFLPCALPVDALPACTSWSSLASLKSFMGLIFQPARPPRFPP